MVLLQYYLDFKKCLHHLTAIISSSPKWPFQTQVNAQPHIFYGTYKNYKVITSTAFISELF